MKFILKYILKYKKLLFLDVISVFGFVLVELGIPTIIAMMIDTGVSSGDTGYILKMGVIIVIISVIGVAGTVLLGYCSSKISTAITRDIRNDIFGKVQQFSPSEFNTFGISSLITRTNNDAYQIQIFANMLLRTALLTPVMMVVSFTLIIKTSLDLSLVVASTMPLIIIGVYWVTKRAEPLSEKQQESLDTLNRVSRENLTGIRVIRAFNNDTHEQSRFIDGNKEYTKYSRKVFTLMMLTQPIFFFLMNIAIVGVYWVASTMIASGSIQVGQLVAFIDYLFHAMFSTMLFCSVLVLYPKANISANRIKEVLNTTSLITDKEETLASPSEEGTLVFDDVTFVYPDGEEAILKDISFKATKGETIAFIGSTGSGKSSLINLIPRFYDISVGSIKVDGKDIREYSIANLRDKIGCIPQKATLFTGTIKENICFGKNDATDEEVIEAAKIAQAYDFIMDKPRQFEELITEGGTNMSGGQRQRLSIARAIVKKPDIYIFDDSFSALDYRTDAVLRKELKKHTTQAIVLIVAQRISTIKDADHIVVLDQGKIVGQGRHRQLLEDCDIYYQIATSQLSEEELNHA